MYQKFFLVAEGNNPPPIPKKFVGKQISTIIFLYRFSAGRLQMTWLPYALDSVWHSLLRTSNVSKGAPLDSVQHSLLLTFNISKRCHIHEPTSTNLAWSNNRSPTYDLLGSQTSRADCVSCIKSITAGRDFFLKEKHWKSFFTIRFLQSLDWSRTKSELSGDRVVWEQS